MNEAGDMDEMELRAAASILALHCQHLEKENQLLRQHVEELADAFTVIWISDDHSAWDGKAVERFDDLLAKVESGKTETPNTEVTAAELFQKTIERETTIQSLGYNIITIWEGDYIKKPTKNL